MAFINTLFLIIAKYYPMWMDHILSIHSSVDGHLDCPDILATVNVDIYVQVFVWT